MARPLMRNAEGDGQVQAADAWCKLGMAADTGAQHGAVRIDQKYCSPQPSPALKRRRGVKLGCLTPLEESHAVSQSTLQTAGICASRQSAAATPWPVAHSVAKEGSRHGPISSHCGAD